ncbi:MAG: aminotransferase class I/II-fold pyridoxal phosphate-dependent enzyme, partial [Planctomycetota bacterium]
LRMGWCISSGPEKRMRPLIDAMAKLTRSRLCASTPVQYGIAAALDGDHSFLKTEMQKLQRRRDITFERLNAIDGISCVKPMGAFYAFPRIHTDEDDLQWVRDLIFATGVVVVHGSGFGQKPGTRHFRAVFLPQDDVLEKSYAQIAEFVAKRKR